MTRETGALYIKAPQGRPHCNLAVCKHKHTQSYGAVVSPIANNQKPNSCMQMSLLTCHVDDDAVSSQCHLAVAAKVSRTMKFAVQTTGTTPFCL